MDLKAFPRKIYTEYETPIQHMPNLGKSIGHDGVYIKRDDLLGLSAGGNKTRKLEFLMADALDKGANAIITCGAVQSNHCRLTLSAAVKEGLKCYLVLEERVPASYKFDASGNNFLYHLLGVSGIRVVSGGSDMMKEMKDLACELENQGLIPYIIPGGGSNALGALGYVSCATEILRQMKKQDLSIDKVVVASGSAGTHAGLLAGFAVNEAHIPVVGISVNRDKVSQVSVVLKLANNILDILESSHSLSKEDVIVFDQYVGEGYSRVTSGMVRAVNLLAKTEGILLDPVYTGKAMDGMLDLIEQEYLKKWENILFIHTGGSPALYVYEDDLAWNHRN